MKRLTLRNLQRTVRLNSPALRRQARWLLDELFNWPEYDIGVYLVTSHRMAELNEEHLGHEGSTDVLTFDYSSATRHGELFICPAVAEENAAHHDDGLSRELSRYLIHGLLHMVGHDDRQPSTRRDMKREENRILKLLPADG